MPVAAGPERTRKNRAGRGVRKECKLTETETRGRGWDGRKEREEEDNLHDERKILVNW